MLHVVFVLRGQIELRIGDEHQVLEERSCFTFDGRIRHFWSNRTPEPAEILSFLLRPTS
jgi:hypothetical protein